MNRKLDLRLVALLAAAMMFTLSCGILSMLTENGSNATASADLWADVPKLDGATKTSAELPLPAKLIVNSMMSGKIDFVAYKTSKSADDIKAFYSNETMQGLGWAADSGGCSSIQASTGGGSNPAGGFCVFNRIDGDKNSMLLIVLGQADDGKDTQLFYVRAQLPPTQKP
jgi:hypothetical protein